MTEAYISGYLECISRVKDIITPGVGGFNQFFSIDRNRQNDLLADLKSFLKQNIAYYLRYYTQAEFEKRLNEISLVKIENWEQNLQTLIQDWTCDQALIGLNGKNGYLLSEYLINSLLSDFFSGQGVEVFQLIPDWVWHWGDQMAVEFLFVTSKKIYIMHLGESS